MSRKQREAIIDAMRKKYGDDVITRASEGHALKSVPRISFGIFGLDFSTYGGLPRGRISCIYGKQSSCKSAICLKLVAEAQKICRFCGLQLDAECRCAEPECLQTLWLDAEGTWVGEWAEALGVNADHVYVIQTEFAEQAIDIVDATLRDRSFDLLIVDSLAHLTPSKEIEDSIEKPQVALQARLINKALRVWISSMNAQGVHAKNKPSVVLINQTRDKVSFHGGEFRPGGKGQLFASSLDLKLSGGLPMAFSPGGSLVQMISSNKLPEGTRPAKIEVTYQVTKNKVGPPHMSGKFDFWLQDTETNHIGDTNDVETVWTYADKYKLLRQDEKKGFMYGNLRAGTRKELVSMIEARPGGFSLLRREVLEACLLISSKPRGSSKSKEILVSSGKVITKPSNGTTEAQKKKTTGRKKKASTKGKK